MHHRISHSFPIPIRQLLLRRSYSLQLMNTHMYLKNSKSTGGPATSNERKKIASLEWRRRRICYFFVLSPFLSSAHTENTKLLAWNRCASRNHFSIILWKKQHHLHKYFSGVVLFFFSCFNAPLSGRSVNICACRWHTLRYISSTPSNLYADCHCCALAAPVLPSNRMERVIYRRVFD